MKKKVRALRYPLFCLLGHELRRLWNPKPQLMAEESNKSCFVTKIRWVVEFVRNMLKQIIAFLITRLITSCYLERHVTLELRNF